MATDFYSFIIGDMTQTLGASVLYVRIWLKIELWILHHLFIYLVLSNNCAHIYDRNEVDRAKKQKDKYKFANYLMIAKTYVDGTHKQQQIQRTFVNAEEEIFFEVNAIFNLSNYITIWNISDVLTSDVW